LATSLPDPTRVASAYLSISTRLPVAFEGVSVEAAASASRLVHELMAMREPGADATPLLLLQARAAAGDRAAQALVERFECDIPRAVSREQRGQPPPLETPKTLIGITPLLAFTRATCDRQSEVVERANTLERLAQEEPRFHEARYFLGRFYLGQKKLVSAEREFLASANGFPQMTAAWAMLGSTRMMIEDYDAASADLARALSLEPDQRSVLLTQAKALNFLGRYEEAAVPAAKLIEMGVWFLADANYWLAFSELQLGRLQDADIHVREAKRMNSNDGGTARLSGLVAFRLDQLDRARTEFELAVSRNDLDCEARIQLGAVHGRQEHYEGSVAAFVQARQCYARTLESIDRRRAEIETSSLTDTRKQTALGRLAQQVDHSRRSEAVASLGAAEGEAQRGAFDAALAHLADAEARSDLSSRVAELRARIALMRARRVRS
ncbi:MAG: hypothetical protein ABI672_12500, partial [Vicinamibacteria bacterium]